MICPPATSYWRAPPYCDAPSGGTSPYWVAPNGAESSGYGFAPPIIAKAAVKTTQKDKINDALFLKNQPFCCLMLHDGEDRNNFAKFAQH
jgi:hypothetical protein